MRVGYIAPSLDDTTGWGRWVNDLLRHITAQGVTPVVFAPPSAARHAAAGLDARFVLPELFDYVQSSNGLRQFIGARTLFSDVHRDERLQLVHSLDAHPWGLYGDRLAQRAGVPHVLTTHGRYGYLAENRALDRFLYGKVLRRAAGMVTVSAAVKRAVLKTFGGDIDANQVTVLQNPVDAGQFAAVLAGPPVVAAGDPLLISVTRFIPVKDIETAVLAFRLVRQQLPGAEYYIIGPGTGENNGYFRSIRDLVARERIDGVHIVGRVDKPALSAFYRQAALLLHTAQSLPDDFEASGLILLEAGLFGLPVVASASGGIPEVVDDGVTGRLVAERDVNALAGTLLEVLRDPAALKRMGAANLARARQRNWPDYCAVQRRLYDEVIAGRRSGSAA